MSGGYGDGRGTGGYPRPGYGSDGYGAGSGGPRRPGGRPPRDDDPDWQRDQADGRAGGYGGQGQGGERGYGGQGHRGAQGYDGPDSAGQGYGGGGYPGRGNAQPGDRRGPGPAPGPGPGAGPGFRPQLPPGQQRPAPGQQRSRTGAQPVPGGAGARPGQRMPGQGTGGYPAQPGRGPGGPGEPAGYDQRGGGPRRPAGGYDDDYPPAGYPPHGDAQRGDGGYGPGGYDDWEPEPDHQDDSFVPGFGRRDDYDGGRGQAVRDGRGRGRGDRSRDQGDFDGEHDGYDGRPASFGADPRDRDRRGPGDRRPRAGAPGDGPGGRGPAGRGRQDRDRGDRGRQGRGRGGRGDWERGGGNARPRRRSPIRRLAPWIALLVILIPLAVGGDYVYQRYEGRYHPPDYSGPGTGQVTVQVKNGDTAFGLAPRLVALGVIASSRAFENAAESSANTTGLEAGFYLLHRHMQASLAFAALLNPKNRVQAVVTVPEGLRAIDVARRLAAKTKLPLKDFQQVIAHPAQLDLPPYANGKVEGYLFPDTYAIQPHETALQILQAMVKQFKTEAQQIDITAAAKSVGLTPTQLIIEASLVQAEGGQVSDFPKIAEVIDNRLKAKMPLHFDSTVFYGLGKYGTSATDAEISTPGPYNSYLNVGLPPGPIDNPGNAAIQGVLHRLSGNLLYFIATSSGKTYFSATFPVPIPGG